MRRSAIALLFLGSLFFAAPAFAQPAIATHALDRPNIVIILADDLGYGDLECYNPESRIPTPHLNKLAAESIRFTDAHSPSSVCTPTRYGLLTGRYAWRTQLKKGVLWGYSPCLIEEGRPTIASFLKHQGYATAGFGKWHLGLGAAEKTDYAKPLKPGPSTLGFDYFFGIPASLDMDPYLFFKNDRPVEMPTSTTAASKMRRHGGKGFWRAGDIAPSFRHVDVLPEVTRESVAFIEGRATKDDPFFLYCALPAPHTPWLPLEQFAGVSEAGVYGDFVAQVDSSIGEILAALQRTGLRSNTLVIVTSDNGAHWLEGDRKEYAHEANGRWRGQKADIWEGGHRVPFLVSWPDKIKQSATCEQPICLTDLFATIGGLLKLPIPDDAAEDSFDFSLALSNPAKPLPRPGIIHHSADGMFAIRHGSWKLIEGLGSGGFTAPRRIPAGEGDPTGQLYNLEEDPGEENNQYDQSPEVVSKLAALLEEYKTRGRTRD